MHPIVKINMLFARWEVRIGKNCDRGLEIAAIRTDTLLVNNLLIFFLSLPFSLISLVLIVDTHCDW